MKIGVQTWGSEGDLRPFIALARGLSEAGHQVTFSYADVAFTVPPELVAQSKAKRWSSVAPAHDLADFRQSAQALISKKRIPAKQIVMVLESLLYPMERQLLQAAEALCQDNELVIGHFVLYPLAAAALKAGRPRISVFTAPTHPSREYVPSGEELGPLRNRLFWWLAGFAIETMFSGPPRKLYRAQGLAPARNLLNEVWSSPLLNLVAVSPSLFPQPADWPANTLACGQLSLPQGTPEWPMPESLQHFLAQGPAPLFMTFGSMTAAEAQVEAVTLRLVEAARLSGCRAIIQSDWERLAGIPESPEIYRLSRASHEVVLPHCSAVVHHGGAGTTHAATRAGKPSVVVAHAADQLYWAATLRRAGVAGAPLERYAFTSEKLARAIREVIGSEQMRHKASQLGEQMRREDGVGTAVERIQAVLPALR
jgi:sterol 3beta-glucosyltransferase/vancomycin aglycone glucosyltransferase